MVQSLSSSSLPLLLLLLLLAPAGEALLEQRLAALQLFAFRGYKDVQLFRYEVATEALAADWTFVANETKGCSPRNVSLYLQPWSFPVVNPDGAAFPDRFVLPRALPHRPLHLRLLSDGLARVLNVSHPLPGTWFAAAFLQPGKEPIAPKGLFRSCIATLSSHLRVTPAPWVPLLLPDPDLAQDLQLFQQLSQPITYKFYVPAGTWRVVVNVSRCSTLPSPGDVHCPLLIAARPLALPDSSQPSASSVNCSAWPKSETCALSLIPQEKAWHYVTLTPLTPPLQCGIKVGYESCNTAPSLPDYLLVNDLDARQICSSINKTSKLRVLFPGGPLPRPTAQDCWPRVPLLRKSLAGNFLFEFERATPSNTTISGLEFDVGGQLPTLLTFDMAPILDGGGTFIFELGLDPTVNTSAYNVSVVACLSHGARSAPLLPTNCSSPSGVTALQVNSTRFTAMGDTALLPFPMPGTWHVALRAFCYTKTDGSNISEPVECEGKTRVALGLSSASCVYGRCGPFGKCYQYISGGIIFSTCVCSAGYRGWGCTDDTEATRQSELLLATLLLTLSNLAFLPALIVALKRRFFTEGMVYTCTMLFSTFYHACDEDVYSFCLLKLGVLQFGDFFSAVLSLWVTLIAMAELPRGLTSVLHVGGAVGLALGVENDRTGLWLFVVPTLVGAGLLLASWGARCRSKRGCFPKRRYWLFCLPPGVVCAATGLACFAFLETKANYLFVHSAWHVAMALAIVFLLPLREEDELKEQTQQQRNVSSVVMAANSGRPPSPSPAPSPAFAFYHS